jgi:hypothetical protein
MATELSWVASSKLRRSRCDVRWAGLWLSVALVVLLTGCGAPGARWQAVSTDARGSFFGLGGQTTPVLALSADPQITGLIYVGAAGAGVRRITANGGGVEASGPGMAQDSAVFSLTPDPGVLGAIYAGASTGFYVSTDAAASWQSRNAGLPTDGAITAIATGPHGSPLLAGTERHGLFLSADQGATWRPAVGGLPADGRVATALWVERDKTALVAFTDGHLYTSQEALQDWTRRDTGLPTDGGVQALAASADARAVYAGTTHGLYASGDAGATWASVAGGLPSGSVGALTSDPLQPSAIYAAIENRVYASTDGARTWSALADALDKPASAIAVTANRERSPVTYATTGQLYRYPGLAGGNPLAPVIVALLAAAVILFLFIRSRRMRYARPTSSSATPSKGPSDTRSPAERYGDADEMTSS